MMAKKTIKLEWEPHLDDGSERARVKLPVPGLQDGGCVYVYVFPLPNGKWWAVFDLGDASKIPKATKQAAKKHAAQLIKDFANALAEIEVEP